MKKFYLTLVFSGISVALSAQETQESSSILYKKEVEFVSKFKVPDASFYSPKIDWSKKSTFEMMDGNGGYKSYVVYDNYLTTGRNYGSYFEIAPNCNSAINNPTIRYDATDVGTELIHGIMRDVLGLRPIKIGKSTTIGW